MFLTKECDYGLRAVRALSDGEKRTVDDICKRENIPGEYAYKILKKLERAGILQSIRGRDGGYKLVKPLDSFSIHDIASAIDDNLFIFECLRESNECVHNPPNDVCKVHKELNRIQAVLIGEMQRKTILEVMEVTFE